MESNIIFAQLFDEKSTGTSKFSFIYISRLKSLNLVLIPGAKLEGHRSTWTGCTKIQQNLQGCTSTGLFLIKLRVYNRANASLKLYLKNNSCTGAFLLILQNLSRKLSLEDAPVYCFCRSCYLPSKLGKYEIIQQEV